MNTIKSTIEISRLFESGTRYKCPYITFIVQPYLNKENNSQSHQDGRVAFIAGKKIGNSVWRNSARRRMRAVCRDIGGPWVGYDVIFLAKSGIMNESYSKVLKMCDETLKQHAFKREKEERKQDA